ncbi:MAE_28990/MAE_18760 family HEPN-like nuclease [Providencia rettgeri]|uniref:MAE_28990/MAE_18760 family HEPN-like nuclease n=1 Tax=Providencia rettgeri TaxID=587 RepID=UPI00235F8C12|nr:MAE_28990/MAE_18760 family HEPN-like nuclease [Providencia rettgeri]
MALSDLRDDFNERIDDINETIAMAEELEASYIQMKNNSLSIEDDLLSFTRKIDILKSTLHMLSYNLVECTTRGCIEAIYDHMKDSNICYNDLKLELQKKTLNRIVIDYPNDIERLHRRIGNNISQKLIEVSFNVRKEFNGNITKSTIGDIKKRYGIIMNDAPECRNGVDLDTLKDIRNDLAHGNTAFSKKGAIDTVNDVISRVKNINDFMLLFILATEEYLANQGYLSSQYA